MRSLILAVLVITGCASQHINRSGVTLTMDSPLEGQLTTRNELSTCMVVFGLYDAEGRKVGDAFASTMSLPAGKTWKFKALPMPGVKYKTVRVDRIIAQ